MKGNGWPAALALAAGLGVLLLALSTTTTLWDRDEPRFAQAAVEMLESGQYLLPTFNGELRPQKPILIYWLMTFSLGALWKSEVAVRMWSPIGIAIAALATFAIGQRWWSPRVGLAALVVVALTPLTLLEGVAATTDAVLLAALTVSMALVGQVLDRPRWWHAVALGLAFGVGLLTKGPVALILPLTIATVTAALARPRPAMAGRVVGILAASSLVGVAIFAAWAIPANVATDGRIATDGIVRENLLRSLVALEGHGTPLILAPLYYPAVAIIGFAPWTRHLPAAIRRLVAGGAWRSLPNLFLLSWIAVPSIAFTLAATKLPHYILPIWPALALLVATALAGEEHDVPARAILPPTVRRTALGVVIAVAIVGFGLAPLVERLKPVPYIAEAIQRTPSDAPFFVYEFEEPSLVFYSGRRMVPLVGAPTLVAWSRAPGAALLVAPRAAVEAVERAHGTLGLHEIAARRGWNHVNGDRIDLVAFLRPAER